MCHVTSIKPQSGWIGQEVSCEERMQNVVIRERENVILPYHSAHMLNATSLNAIYITEANYTIFLSLPIGLPI